MGLDFVLAAIAWPDRRAPDWPAIEKAAGVLDADLAGTVARWLSECLCEELDEDEPGGELGWARAATCHASRTVEGALDQGSRWMTLVEHRGWSLLLDGGVSSGEDPTPTWSSTNTLAESGLLGEALAPWLEGVPRASHLRTHRLLVDSVRKISGQSKLAVVAFPASVDWERAGACLPPEGQSKLERLADVLAGGYSRRAKSLKLGEATLFIGDREDPDGAVDAIRYFEEHGVFAAIGARLLGDVRQAAAETSLVTGSHDCDPHAVRRGVDPDREATTRE